MDLELSVYGALCETSQFKINGIEANREDFGDKEDLNPDDAEDYGCGDMTFTPKLPTQEILDKYKINLAEYNEICRQLAEKLSFGECGWCI